jgi:hypothetical protein
VLLEDDLAGAKAEAGESLRGSEIGCVVSENLMFGFGEGGIGNVDDGGAVRALRGYGENSAAVLAHHMQGVVDDLDADLEKLVGISADEQQFLRILSADFDF